MTGNPSIQGSMKDGTAVSTAWRYLHGKHIQALEKSESLFKNIFYCSLKIFWNLVSTEVVKALILQMKCYF